jgi:hypothetical protein
MWDVVVSGLPMAPPNYSVPKPYLGYQMASSTSTWHESCRKAPAASTA